MELRGPLIQVVEAEVQLEAEAVLEGLVAPGS